MSETTTCDICNELTRQVGTGRHDKCWNLLRIVQSAPEASRRALAIAAPQPEPDAGGEWRVDGYEINDGKRSIVRAPDPAEFPGLTSEQRQRVAAASRENLRRIVSGHNAIPRLIKVLRFVHACGTLRSDGTCDGCPVSAALALVKGRE